MKAGKSLIIAIMMNCTLAASQPPGTNRESINLGEDFRMLTDRSIYIAGESICFTVFNLSKEYLRDLNWSRVYYVELISPQGTPYTQKKLALDSTGAAGSLLIPEEIPSGTYYLKGYTRWMRNFGTANYTYLGIEIVNPYLREVLPVDTSSLFSTGLSWIGKDQSEELLTLVHLSERYTRREPVKLELRWNRNFPPGRCCVSVFRKGSLEKQRESFPADCRINKSQTDHIPETRGVSLTGQVRSAATGARVAYAAVYVETIDQKGYFQCNYTDSLGRFYFAYPDNRGKKDLFISARHPDHERVDLFVEQDFCPEPVRLPSYPLLYDDGDMKLVSELAVNAQIRDQYRTLMSEPEILPAERRDYFYGTPPVTVRFDDFIRLPTLSEYFTEVIPQVTVRGSQGKREFRVTGEHHDLRLYPPLVMIDGVVIFDVESVLAVSPVHVNYVEIVDAPYIRGNLTFGGIINIITREGNMGYMDLPSSGLLVNYMMVDQESEIVHFQPPVDPVLPDVRNTCLWIPELIMAPGDRRKIVFQSGDVSGAYELVVRGYLEDGTYIQQRWGFEIRQ